jgi:hypothetical protein
MSVLPTDLVTYGSLSMPGYDGATQITAAIATSTAPPIAFSVTANASFPQVGEFAILIDSEILWVTQGAGTNNWTALRGYGGTTPATHLINANVTSVSGGPVDFTTRVAFSDVTAGDSVDIVSSLAADSKTIISVAGRDVPGNFVSGKTGILGGVTPTVGIGSGQTFDRLLYVGLGAGTTSTVTMTNATTTLTTAANANFPAAGNYYIKMANEYMQVTAGQGTNSWTISRGVLGSVAIAHASGDNIYLVPFGDVAIYDHTPILSARTMQTGSAQSTGTTPALAKLQSGDGASCAIGQIIRTTGGTGPNQIRYITAVAGYAADQIAVHRDWDTLPDATTTYAILKGWVLEFKAGAGVGATVNNQVTAIQRSIWGAAADVPTGAQRVFYEKLFVVSNNTVTDFTGANIQISSDAPSLPGSALLDIAMCKAANDTFAAVNRQTLPTNGDTTALPFVTQPAAVNVIANSAALVHGAAPNAAGAQGVWMRLTLPAGTTAYKGAANLRTQGNTI